MVHSRDGTHGMTPCGIGLCTMGLESESGKLGVPDASTQNEKGQCPFSLLIHRRTYGKVSLLWFFSRPPTALSWAGGRVVLLATK